MKSVPTVSLLRKLTRWVPSAHFHCNSDGRICLSAQKWQQEATNRHQPLREQILELLKAASNQKNNLKVRAEAEYALTVLGTKSTKQHLDFLIIDL